jgi:hypothetical protein
MTLKKLYFSNPLILNTASWAPTQIGKGVSEGETEGAGGGNSI